MLLFLGSEKLGANTTFKPKINELITMSLGTKPSTPAWILHVAPFSHACDVHDEMRNIHWCRMSRPNRILFKPKLPTYNFYYLTSIHLDDIKSFLWTTPELKEKHVSSAEPIFRA